MLATYAMHLLLWRQTSVGALRCLILTHHVKALAAVRDGLPSASGGQTCEGMLCAIVALACYAHLQGDLPGWKQHMSAINRIIEQSYFTWADLSPGIQNLVQWYVCPSLTPSIHALWLTATGSIASAHMLSTSPPQWTTNAETKGPLQETYQQAPQPRYLCGLQGYALPCGKLSVRWSR